MRSTVVVCAVLLGWASLASAETPRQRAVAVLDAQVAALKKGKAGRDAFLATFDANAAYAGTQVSALAKAGAQLSDLTGERPPPNASAKLSSATLDNLEVGGNEDAVWFTVDLTMTYAATPGQSFSIEGSYRFRVTELLAADRGWKPVVLHVYRPQTKDDWQAPAAVGKIAGGKKLGSLGKLALSPANALKSLATGTDVFVYGTLARERYIGEAAARKQLASWSKLRLAPGTLALQDSGAGWGYAITDVRAMVGANKVLPMRVLALALPGAKANTWQVVALGYSRAY